MCCVVNDWSLYKIEIRSDDISCVDNSSCVVRYCPCQIVRSHSKHCPPARSSHYLYTVRKSSGKVLDVGSHLFFPTRVTGTSNSSCSPSPGISALPSPLCWNHLQSNDHPTTAKKWLVTKMLSKQLMKQLLIAASENFPGNFQQIFGVIRVKILHARELRRFTG